MLEDVLKEDIIQNLEEAGCDGEKIKCFMNYVKQGDVVQVLGLLEAHRSLLLENVHLEGLRISCLDYLVYIIKRK